MMKATDSIRISLETSKILLDMLIDDMKDAPLTQPTPNGGNHPLWVIGHLAYGEAELLHVHIQGAQNPLSEWKELFDSGSEPTTDASTYPSYEEVCSAFQRMRSQTLAYLETISDDDLDKPSHASPPPGLEPFLGTIGKCLITLSLHTMAHRGQVADARHAAGRKPVMM